MVLLLSSLCVFRKWHLTDCSGYEIQGLTCHSEFGPDYDDKWCFQQVGKHLLSFSNAWAEEHQIKYSIVMFCFPFGPFLVGSFECVQTPSWDPSCPTQGHAWFSFGSCPGDTMTHSEGMAVKDTTWKNAGVYLYAFKNNFVLVVLLGPPNAWAPVWEAPDNCCIGV